MKEITRSQTFLLCFAFYLLKRAVVSFVLLWMGAHLLRGVWGLSWCPPSSWHVQHKPLHQLPQPPPNTRKGQAKFQRPELSVSPWTWWSFHALCYKSRFILVLFKFYWELCGTFKLCPRLVWFNFALKSNCLRILFEWFFLKVIAAAEPGSKKINSQQKREGKSCKLVESFYWSYISIFVEILELLWFLL